MSLGDVMKKQVGPEGSTERWSWHDMVGWIEAKIGGGNAAAGALAGISQEALAPVLRNIRWTMDLTHPDRCNSTHA